MYLSKGVMVEIKGDGACKVFSAMSDTWMSACLVTSDSFWPHGLVARRFLCPGDFPDKNIGVGCHFFLQGKLPDPGMCLLHW